MYGRNGDLAKLDKDRNDPRLSKFQRQQADKAHAEIVSQLKDRKLMSMRERLINAARANDLPAQAKIQAEMRAYLHQDQETGL